MNVLFLCVRMRCIVHIILYEAFCLFIFGIVTKTTEYLNFNIICI